MRMREKNVPDTFDSPWLKEPFGLFPLQFWRLEK